MNVGQFIQAVLAYKDRIFQNRSRLHQRKSKKIKRDKAQAKSCTTRGDDADPDVEPDSLVPVSWFQGSRLASGSSPSPSKIEVKLNTEDKRLHTFLPGPL